MKKQEETKGLTLPQHETEFYKKSSSFMMKHLLDLMVMLCLSEDDVNTVTDKYIDYLESQITADE